jgi:hypothetical protein
VSVDKMIVGKMSVDEKTVDKTSCCHYKHFSTSSIHSWQPLLQQELFIIFYLQTKITAAQYFRWLKSRQTLFRISTWPQPDPGTFKKIIEDQNSLGIFVFLWDHIISIELR